MNDLIMPGDDNPILFYGFQRTSNRSKRFLTFVIPLSISSVLTPAAKALKDDV